MKKIEKCVEAKCSGCGGNLLFSPASQDLVCERCSSHFQIKNGGEIIPHDYVEGKNSKDNSDWVGEGRMFKCKACGGEVSLQGHEISNICPYCGSGYVSEIASLAGLKPDCVIPFAFDKESGAKKFKEGVQKKFFLPSAFKKDLPKSKIYGLYVPCFSFSGEAKARYKGTLAEDVVRENGKGETFTQTRHFPIFGEEDIPFDNITVEASQKLTQKELSSISPYNHERSCKFDDGYLRGYYVEHYSDSLDSSHDEAKKILQRNARNQILSKYSYDRVVSLDINMSYSNEKYLYKLIPVYKFEYSYKKKKYLTCMNGQTGKIQGNLPKSGWKIFGVVGGIVAVILAIFLIWFLI